MNLFDARFGRWRKLHRKRAPKAIIFGVGAAKTGTTSLAAVFKRSGITAAHEPDCDQLIELSIARKAGSLGAKAFRSRVREIIETQALDVNVSQINGFIIDDLFPVFPEAKYILTIRDADSWVRSFFNHAATRPLEQDNVWHRFRALRFNQNLPYRSSDENLRHAGFQSLDSYLTYWMDHTMRVLSVVPEGQLLLLPTDKISERLDVIAEFVGYKGVLSVEDAHGNKGSYATTPLVERTYLEERCASFTNLLIERANRSVSSRQLHIIREAVAPPTRSYYAQATDQRIAHTESLKAVRSSDVERWKNVDAESDERWEGRARLAASMIVDQPSVADLGCGSMLIERHLEAGVRYIPIDVVRRDPRTIVWDFNASSGCLPPQIDASCAIVLGLLEYLHDVPSLLSNLAHRFRCVICSYLPIDTTPSIEQRRATGWMSDYSIRDLETIYAEAGLRIERKETYRDKTILWRLARQF